MLASDLLILLNIIKHSLMYIYVNKYIEIGVMQSRYRYIKQRGFTAGLYLA